MGYRKTLMQESGNWMLHMPLKILSMLRWMPLGHSWKLRTEGRKNSTKVLIRNSIKESAFDNFSHIIRILKLFSWTLKQ